MNPLNKPCTGSRCENKDRCPLYAPKPANPFNCVSPLDRYDECPYWPPYGYGSDDEAND